MPRSNLVLAHRPRWWSVLAAMLACGGAFAQSTTQPAAQDAEREAHAAVQRALAILTIAPYITVATAAAPEGPPAPKCKRYRIGVVGTDQVATAVQQELPGKKVEQACVTVTAVEPKTAATGTAAADFDLLWIAASVDDVTLAVIVAAHRDKPVVLVCERPGFAALGGGVQVFVKESCVRFEVN